MTNQSFNKIKREHVRRSRRRKRNIVRRRSRNINTTNYNVNVVKNIDTDIKLSNNNSRRSRRSRRNIVNTSTHIVYTVRQRPSKSKKMRKVPIVSAQRIRFSNVRRNRVRNRVRNKGRNLENEPEEKKKGCGCGR
jgi:hypothetical protein